MSGNNSGQRSSDTAIPRQGKKKELRTRENREKERYTMDCPFLKYEDTGWFSYKFYCKACGRKIGDENDKTQVENTCRNSEFYDCPIYKREKG